MVEIADKLQILQRRVSIAKLQLPAPTKEILDEVFRAATRAADHGLLKPWRFLVIEGDALTRLGMIFESAAKLADPNVSVSVLERSRTMPHRAPMIIVAIASNKPHIKIPKQEQVIACGAAVQNILNALFALNFGAIWRSGEVTRDPNVCGALGLATNEEIIGFVYVGTPVAPISAPPQINVAEVYQYWGAE